MCLTCISQEKIGMWFATIVTSFIYKFKTIRIKNLGQNIIILYASINFKCSINYYFEKPGVGHFAFYKNQNTWKKPEGIIYHPIRRAQILYLIARISFQDPASQFSPVSKSTALSQTHCIRENFSQIANFLFMLWIKINPRKMCLKLPEESFQ